MLLSIHYIVLLHDSYCGPRYDDIKGIKFEIQLRTIATHAWSCISHHLDYKHPNAIPSYLKKSFYALSALFYLADSNFETLLKDSIAFKKNAIEKNLEQISREEINLDTLISYLSKKFPKRKHAPLETISLLSEELNRSGYKTISQLNEKINVTLKALDELEKKVKRKFHNAGLVRNALSILGENYKKNLIKPLFMPKINRSEFRKFLIS